MKFVKARAEKVTHDARNGLTEWLDGLNTMTVIQGHAKLEDAKTVIVNGQVLTAPAFS